MPLAWVPYADLAEAQRRLGRVPDGTMPTPGGWNRFSIEVTDLDALVGKLHDDGVRFRNDIVNGVGGRQIIADDPSGNPEIGRAHV